MKILIDKMPDSCRDCVFDKVLERHEGITWSQCVLGLRYPECLNNFIELVDWEPATNGSSKCETKLL